MIIYVCAAKNFSENTISIMNYYLMNKTKRICILNMDIAKLWHTNFGNLFAITYGRKFSTSAFCFLCNFIFSTFLKVNLFCVLAICEYVLQLCVYF